ncbi:MAG TPA: hypothetical protein VFT59_04460 [Candidatus Saccharimonadales bacterium]|nr:hypothetical protein [Candidatus Saccharimonadales bacterium]
MVSWFVSKWAYWLIALFLLLLHVFIFRDVIVAIPSILAGDTSIVREELVPFFEFGSQFWGDGASALTSSEEVRVSYSFWTAWVRHYQVLPFALVIMNALSAFLLFYAFHRVGRFIYKKSLFGMVAALIAALLIHTILLYAKIAHFYVLIIGFSMFALSLSLFLEQLFFKGALQKKNIFIVSALTLFNPAIHYHVIFYVVAVLIILIHLLFTRIMNKAFFWKYAKRSFLYFTAIVLLSFVPYIIYIFLSTPSSTSGISTQIPVNYWMIYYASLPLPFIFSLDTAGHLDLIRHGNYLAPIPRFGSMLVLFLIAGLFIFKRWQPLHIVAKVFIMTLFGVMVFAMWMTIGYSENSPYSFHKFFGDIAIFLSNTGGAIGAMIASGMGTFINILRFPHRFQFIYFYAVGVLFMVSLVWLREVLATKMRPIAAIVVTMLIGIAPVIANGDYRVALTSGDLATFVTPYRVPDDLKAIKQRLSGQHNRLFILPTLESGREIIHDDKSYSFLDKYLIYYLNEPTYYYGVGANTENKAVSYLVYRAIAYNEKWWQDILANDLAITDILVPKHVKPREKGITYLPEIDAKISQSLQESSKYKKTYSGEDYDLYSLEKASTSSPRLIDMQWQETLEHLNSGKLNEQAFLFPLQMRKFMERSNDKLVMTTSAERTFYNLYTFTRPSQVAVPNPVSLAFSSQYVASSNFTNNALSLSTLYAKQDDYNYLHENIPSLMNLQRPSFVGLTKGDTELDMKVTIPEDGGYRLLLHAGSKGDEIKARIDGQDIIFKKIADDQQANGDYIDISYFYADVTLKTGRPTLSLQNHSQNAIIIDSVTVMPAAEAPSDFRQVTMPRLNITPTDDPMVLRVTAEVHHDK